MLRAVCTRLWRNPSFSANACFYTSWVPTVQLRKRKRKPLLPLLREPKNTTMKKVISHFKSILKSAPIGVNVKARCPKCWNGQLKEYPLSLTKHQDSAYWYCLHKHCNWKGQSKLDDLDKLAVDEENVHYSKTKYDMEPRRGKLSYSEVLSEIEEKQLPPIPKSGRNALMPFAKMVYDTTLRDEKQHSSIWKRREDSLKPFANMIRETSNRLHAGYTSGPKDIQIKRRSWNYHPNDTSKIGPNIYSLNYMNNIDQKSNNVELNQFSNVGAEDQPCIEPFVKKKHDQSVDGSEAYTQVDKNAEGGIKKFLRSMNEITYIAS